MRFSVVVLCFMALSINMVLALEPPRQPIVVANDLKNVKGRPDTDDWDHHENNNNGHGHENNGGHEHSGHSENHGEWVEPNHHCKRKWPLSENGPFRTPYEFHKYKVDPDLLKEAPAFYLEVDYKNLSHHCQPELGNHVDLCGLLHQPRLRWRCDSEKKYTIFLIDVNPYGEKTPKIGQNGILWFLADVPGCHLRHGKPISHYQTPTPGEDFGPSRYALLVYEQPAYKIDWSEEPVTQTTSFKYRFFRCLGEIVRKYELKLLAGNFFYTEWNPCLKTFVDSIDLPIPEYMDHATAARARTLGL